MEKIISEEDRIKRAEEISARRKNRIPASSINVKGKRKMSLMTKTFIQIISSICIFGIIYFLCQNNSLAIEKIRPVISNDADFQKIYYQVNDVIKNLIKDDDLSNKTNNENSQENLNEGEEKNKSNEINNDENTNNTAEKNNNTVGETFKNETASDNAIQIASDDGVGGGNDGTAESQTDQDISYIKANANFIKPLSGTITSRYGSRTPTEIISANHGGVDIGANVGTDVIASMEGTVELVSSEGDYGKHLKITKGEISTLYAHCSKIVVNQGDYITQGQKIAEVGATGRVTGPHLHFEIRRNNVTIDPEKILEL